MKIFITGECGLIAQNIVKEAKENFSQIEFVTGAVDYLNMHQPGEPCVYQNSIEQWEFFFRLNKIDVIIHNAAVVNTEVVGMNLTHATRTNDEGTYRICVAAKKCGIPVCYMGTTVIYDAFKYQDEMITEASEHGPHTLYGCQKLCAEHIVKSHADKWMIIRPLFAYGGEGDMNSLIAKSIYGYLAGKKVEMRLNPSKYKDYMYVSDYANAVLTGITKGLWNDEWNIAAETPMVTGNIIKTVEDVCNISLEDTIIWKPESDYTGHHRIDSSKFRNATGWKPKITLTEGIRMAYETIESAEGYNPLIHLEEAAKRNIDVGAFFNESRIARKTISKIPEDI